MIFLLCEYVMTDMQHPGLLAQQAQATMGYYATDMEDGDPLVPLYTIEVSDRAGVALLRRLLTIDVKNLHSGQTKPSFILNALGNVMDIAFVTHLRDADEHYRVSFHTAETLAWVHQVAKAFDAEFDTLTVTTVRVWGKDIARLGVAPNTMKRITVGETEVTALHTGESVLLQAEGAQWIDALEGVRIDWIAANTLSILAGETNAIDWMTGDMSPVQLGKTAWLDLSDAYRVFIGRALTEALAKHGTPTAVTTIACEVENAEGLFEEGVIGGVYTQDGDLIAKTYRIGLTGNTLIARIDLPQNLDTDQCVWVNGEEFSQPVYRFEVR